MKIIGFSDVITNSSSEVFIIYNEEACENIKKIVNAILEVAGSDKTFDDLFTISLYFDEDWTWDCYLEDHPDADRDKVSNDELLKFALAFDNKNYDGYTLVNGIEIKAKDPNNQHTAEVLSTIDNIFNVEYRYC